MKAEQVTCPHCGARQDGQVSLGAIHAAHTRQSEAKKKAERTPAQKVLLAVLIALAVAALCVGGWLLAKQIPTWFVDKNAEIDDKFDSSEQGELDINTELPTQGILNIALFGLDERGDTDGLIDGLGNGKSFHSDAIIILTIDTRDPAQPQVKMTSLARDTLVYVEGYNSKNSMTKLTHAFDYGYRKAKNADLYDNGKKDLTEADYKRAGAKVAIKTINANFNMNITEYMYVNFVEFMDIIDSIGGVTINVKQKELAELNKHVKWMEKECNRDIAYVDQAGEQTLSGGQALAYARVRKVDSDLVRANRQKDVLMAVFNKVKTTPVTKLPDVAAKMLSLCHTTLSADEIVNMGMWAVTKNPTITNYTLPDTKTSYGYSWIWEGNHPNYGWVWIYDLRYATALLHDFIYETETAKDMPRPTTTAAPAIPTTTTIGGFVDPTVDPTLPVDPTGDPTVDPTAPTDTTGDATVDPTGSTDATGTQPTGGEEPTQPTDTQPTQPTDTTTTPAVDVVITTTTTMAFVTP